MAAGGGNHHAHLMVQTYSQKLFAGTSGKGAAAAMQGADPSGKNSRRWRRRTENGSSVKCMGMNQRHAKAASATGWLRTTAGCGRSNRGDGHKLQTAEATATRWICNGIKDIHGCGRSNVAMGRNDKQLRKQGHVGYAMASGTYQTLLRAVHGKRLAETIECEESVAALLRRASQLRVVVQTAADT